MFFDCPLYVPDSTGGNVSRPVPTGAHVLLGNRVSEWACWKGGQGVGKAGGQINSIVS